MLANWQIDGRNRRIRSVGRRIRAVVPVAAIVITAVAQAALVVLTVLVVFLVFRVLGLRLVRSLVRLVVFRTRFLPVRMTLALAVAGPLAFVHRCQWRTVTRMSHAAGGMTTAMTTAMSATVTATTPGKHDAPEQT